MKYQVELIETSYKKIVVDGDNFSDVMLAAEEGEYDDLFEQKSWKYLTHHFEIEEEC